MAYDEDKNDNVKRHGGLIGWAISMAILALAGNPGTFSDIRIQIGSLMILIICVTMDVVCNAISDRWASHHTS